MANETVVEWIPNQRRDSIGGCLVCDRQSVFLVFFGHFRMQTCRECIAELRTKIVEQLNKERRGRLSMDDLDKRKGWR